MCKQIRSAQYRAVRCSTVSRSTVKWCLLCFPHRIALFVCGSRRVSDYSVEELLSFPRWCLAFIFQVKICGDNRLSLQRVQTGSTCELFDFCLVKQKGFTLIFQVKSMPMQHMLTLHMFVRSPHTSPCRNGQRLQRWDDDHDGTITINTTDEEDSIRQSSCFCVFQNMSYCLPCVPYAWLCTQQQHFFLNRKWSESNSHTAYACPNQKLLREIRSVIRGLPPTSCWCGYFLLAFIGNSALLGAYSIEG